MAEIVDEEESIKSNDKEDGECFTRSDSTEAVDKEDSIKSNGKEDGEYFSCSDLDEIVDEENSIKSNSKKDGEYFTCSGCTTKDNDPKSQNDKMEVIVTTDPYLTDLETADIKSAIIDQNINTKIECGLENQVTPNYSQDLNTPLKVKVKDTSNMTPNKKVQKPIDISQKHLCILCTYRNETNIASKYCVECRENLCETCSLVHKGRIATKQHAIVEFQSSSTMQAETKNCIPCQYRNQTNIAAWYCKDCEETLCVICCTEHRKSKATSNHAVVKLLEGTNVETLECDVCNMAGTSATATQTCEICKENLCDKCTLDHRRRKATKDHNLLDLQNAESKHDHCDVCKLKGENLLALKYCDECSEKLCEPCSCQHKMRKATANHMLFDMESYHLKSSDIEEDMFFCDPCEQLNRNSFASSFCESCAEFLCSSCVNHHKKMKATSNHTVNDIRGDNGVPFQSFTCDPCSTERKTLNAQFYCRVCEEYFCTTCSKQHRSFKATKEHKQVNLKEETANLFLNKYHCDVCKMDDFNKKACLFCDICDEAYCSQCAKIHSSQKATRQHVLEQVDTRKKVSINKDQTDSDNDKPDHETTVPGKPIMDDVTTNSIRIRWNGPVSSSKTPIHYDIRYREESEEKWHVHSTETSRELDTIPGLKCFTEYRFKVRAVYGDRESKDSHVSDIIKTKLSLARKIKEYSLPLHNNNGSPEIYKVPIREQMKCRNEHAKTRRCVFGESAPGVPEKTIMVLGATGAGKSTLIEGMVNYIFDVSWEDDFRFSIIDLMEEEKIKNNDQTISQTEWITCYTLNWLQDCQIYYTLNIIDTPGFGDTRGIERDQKVVEQIRELFTLSGDQGIATLDGICFVTQAPLARLTAPHTYIIDSILSIFGRDITENIFGLITFADGKKPPVVDALKTADVPIVKTFAFNNSAIFEENKNIPSDSFSPMFWNMGKASFSSFFKYLTGKKSVSLQLTSEVLEERKQLETLVEGLRPQINEGLSVIETLRQETAILKKHECDIRENKDFTYTVNKTCQRKVDLQPGIHVTNCLICNRTCHENCRIADDAKKNKCSAMKNGTCTICPQYCSWQEHKNNSYKFEFYTKKVKSTYKELQARYNTAQSGASKQKQIVHEIRQQVMINEKSVQCMIEKMRVTINKISSIALKPNPLNSVQYIDLLIDAERREAKQGYRSRMQTLHKFRDNALLLQNVPDRNYKPFGDIAEYMGEKGKSETNTKGEGLKQKIINLFK